MLKQHLHDNWRVQAAGDLSEVPSTIRGQMFPANVPGCVHTDLLRAGKIPDPYLDLNEYALQWIGQTDWEYRTTFDADPKLFDHERIDLVFDGLDTVAKIELNGTLVGQTQNMFRSFRFDVRKILKQGKNELRVTFASPVKSAFAMREKLGSRPWVNGAGGPFNFIRKMACNFGWDWGPVLTTCGIWRGVRVEGWSGLRIVSVRPKWETRVANASKVLWVDVGVERTAAANPNHALDGHLTLKGDAIDFSSEFAESDPGTIDLCFEVADPQLWWPTNHGDQPLYDLKIQTQSDDWNGRIGLRTVELDTSSDSIGSKFVLKVNGKSIFCKGFNWIPDDCFLDRACDPARVRKRIQQAVDAGANMLRVWGGGIYETDDFYNICDELGVLVWQDFPFACAMYPEEEPFWSEVEAEARENVARLSPHPSLVLWNGNNENLWAYRDWGWQTHEDVVGKTWGKNYYLDLLPRVMKEVDPSRPYWAASPWSGDRDVDKGIHPNDPNHGNMHVWGPWFRDDYVTYRKSAPRFCSEFGFQAPANYATIARVVPQDKRDFGSREMRHRQKSGDVRDDGDLRNLRHLRRHFNLPGLDELIQSLTVPEPRPPLPAPGVVQPLHAARESSRVNFDDLHYLLQLNQCRALTLGVEWFRSRTPTCMGTLYWQLNDCWPGVTSWSAIDGDGRFKPLWYATRRFYAGVLGTIQPEPDGSLAFYLVNDTDEPFSKRVFFYRLDFDGKQLALSEPVRATVPPRSVGRVSVDPNVARAGDPTREWLSAEFSLGESIWFYEADRNLKYSQPAFDSELTRVGNEHRLTIRARTLLRDVVLMVDRLDPDATVNDNVVTILPGHPEFTFVIKSDRELHKDALTSPPVFQCANRFGANSV